MDIFDRLNVYCQSKYSLIESKEGYFSFSYNGYVIGFQANYIKNTIEIILKDIEQKRQFIKVFKIDWIESKPINMVIEYILHSIIKDYITSIIDD